MIDRLTGFLVTVIIVLGSYTVYQYLEARQLEQTNLKLIGTVDKEERLNGDLLKLKTEYKTEQALRSNLENKFKELTIKLTEKTKLLADISVNLGGRVEAGTVVKLGDKDSPEICYKTEETIGVYPFTIDTDVALLRDTATGKYRMITSSYYILDPSIKSEWAGLPYQLTRTEGLLEIDPTEESLKLAKGMVWFPFNLNIGVNTDRMATLTTTLLGYGYRKQDLDFKALSIGVAIGDSRKAEPFIELFSVRPLPSLFTNTYVGVGYGLDSKISITISAGL